MPFFFNTLLSDVGINPAEVRLLRHQTGKIRGRTPYSLWRDDRAMFDRYQSYQLGGDRRAYFDSPYWAAFVMPPTGQTMFVGLYAVSLMGPVTIGETCPLSGVLLDDRHEVYELAPQEPLMEFSGRLSIHWGDSSSASRAWVQRAGNQNKQVVELTRKFEEEEFPGFTSMTRPLSEIEAMPLGWQAVLKATRGVYLLACPKTREHYVGSAYGQDGFLGRWRSYVSDGHGGNVALRIRDPSDYVVSILEVAGSNTSMEDIIALENVWKAKLLSRDIGLNRN